VTARYVACPLCKAEGRDSTGNHLKLFEDGKAGWCMRGHGRVVLDADGDDEGGARRVSYTSRPAERDTALEMAQIATYKCLAYPQRKITKETMEFFGVKTAVSPETGQPAEHYYPGYDEFDVLSGYKCRILPKNFGGKGVIGKYKNWVGWNKVVGRKFVIVVEGEQDMLACHEMMKVLKPDRPPYNVLSVPSGAPEPDENGRVNLGKDLRLLLPKLLEFEKVVLCLDMDGPGRALANAIAEFLCSTTAVSIASLPAKDSAQMWEEGREQEWAKAINNARKYVTADIVTAADDPDEVDEPLVEGTRYSFLPRTCDKLHGFRTQEMTGWIAPENVGKSSMMRQMMYEDLARDPDAHVGAIFLEETAKKTKQAVVAYHCGVPLNKYRANPSCADPVLKQEAKKLLFPRMHLFTHKTQTVSDDLILRKIEYFVKAMGCKRIYVDHLSFVVSAMDTKDERRTIDTFLTKLARSVEDWDYCLNIVSHIKRGEREQARMESKQKYPYWEILKMEDARGSGGISQLCHNMVAIEREVLDPNLDNTRGRVRTRVLRAREWGFTGLGDVLTFNEEGKYAPIVIEEFES